MSSTIYDQNDVLRKQWDDDTRTYHEYDEAGVQTSTRPYTTEENAAADAEAARALAAVNEEALTAITELDGRLDRLAEYRTDVDLLAVMANPNNTALPTATQNRALKTLIRENQRQSATISMLVRLIDPRLLTNIADTVE